MSRRQYKLTLEEGEVWDRITGNGYDVGSPLEDVQRPGDDSISEEAIGDEGNSVALDPGHEPTTASVSGISEEALLSLAQKSSLMSESYKRSAHPPTTQTYDECKELLSAMGVPCIEATGAYEAEAVASSLVLNGHADYVASEDTVSIIPYPFIAFGQFIACRTSSFTKLLLYATSPTVTLLCSSFLEPRFVTFCS